ncbi:MAG: stage II sporulation protein R [Turicibacter sp.]|nr:stage II sporulation protein R [Turicibacter sp.]
MNDKMKFFLVGVVLMAVTAYQLGQLGTTPVTGPVHAEMNEPATAAEVNDNAIRIRVIPNSNAFEDQLAKRIARYAIDELLADNGDAMGSVEATRSFLVNNIQSVNDRLSHIFASIGYETAFEVTYGQHLFPAKQWDGQVFPAGYYESLVVRIGEGRGNNWWCFVNPGVCLGPALGEMENPGAEGWNFLYNARENAQTALLDGDFSFYVGSLFETWFGGNNQVSAMDGVAVATPVAVRSTINWYLFDDEK